MNVYKYLIKNKIREEIKLYKNMGIECVVVAAIYLFVIYGVGKSCIPVIIKMDKINVKIFVLILSLITCCNFMSKKRRIIVKPMTLFLFDKKRLEKIFIIKHIEFFIKYMVLSIIFAMCTCGIRLNLTFYKAFLVYFISMSLGLLLQWNAYNEHSQKRKIFFKVINLVVLGLGYLCIKSIAMLAILIIFFAMVFIYTIKFLKIDYCKYNEDIKYIEKVNVAQRNKNFVLVSQLAKEKLASEIKNKKCNTKFLKKYPLMWKAFTSISRLGKTPIIVGIGFFVTAFIIYIFPPLWNMPIIEVEMIRKALLMFGIFAVSQMSIQTFAKQLEDIIQKQRDGLYIPEDTNKIILQFSLVPIMFLVLVTIVLVVVLKSQICFGIVYFCELLIYLFATLILIIKNKKLLKHFFIILNILMFVATRLLLM